MGKIFSSYKKAIYDEIIDNISSNTSHYYAFVSNPKEVANVVAVSNDDYSSQFVSDWQMIFGKKLSNTNIYPVIDKNIWASNTIYERYDNTSNTVYSNSNFYVVSEPTLPGGSYHIYKCIDNANGSVSTINPSSHGTPTQATSFDTSDNYRWRYITSISAAIYQSFATNDYIPVYPNTTIQTSSLTNAGVEVVMIVNSGIGYASYASGTVKSNPNSSLIEIDSSSAPDNDFYTKNAIYIYNNIAATSQLFEVAQYVANTTGKWVYLNGQANTTNITPAVTQYRISPKVVFDTDGSSPTAYSVINATSNSIGSVVILDGGASISYANVSIQSNSSYGTGANLYAIVPPPGGHGADPASELNIMGLGIAFSFSNTEGNTIITSNTVYNKIGILKNPYSLNTNGTKGVRYYANTFSALLDANVSYTFTKGEAVYGANSGARGTVVFSNSSHVFLTGDKYFQDGEYLANSSGSLLSTITINTLGDIYAKDVRPLYVQNINNVNRSNTQTESFKLIIQV
jgi:hypothetical protein